MGVVEVWRRMGGWDASWGFSSRVAFILRVPEWLRREMVCCLGGVVVGSVLLLSRSAMVYDTRFGKVGVGLFVSTV